MRCDSATVACLVHAGDVDWESTSDVTVLSGGSITSRQGSTIAPFVNFGLTSGSQHGGFAFDSPGEPYGSTAWPREPGRGVVAVNGGGGPLWLRAGGVCRVEAGGEVSAAGMGHEAQRGHGSGGSLIMQCTSFSGDGAIHANGGGLNHFWAASSGAGGRVAIYGDTSTFTGTLSALGGVSNHGRQAGPGTVFTKVTISFPSRLVSPRNSLHLLFICKIGNITELIVGNGDTPEVLAAGVNDAPPYTLTKLLVRDSPLWLGADASIRTRNVTGNTAIDITQPQGLVVFSPVCDTLAAGISYIQHPPLVLHLHANQPSSGSYAASTVISGDMNAAWSTLLCRFDTVTVHSVVTAASNDPCGQTKQWTCSVPPKPIGVSVVEVTVSVDGGVSWHSFATPYTFKFDPTGKGVPLPSRPFAN